MSAGGPRQLRHAGMERPISGRMVLTALVGFFGFVMLVNIVMVHAAISTFGGVDTLSSYQAGLAFKAEEDAALTQAARNWHVDARIAPTVEGAVLHFDVRDAGGRPVTGVDVSARLAHPADERRDIAVIVSESGAGIYSGRVVTDPGQWTLDIEIVRAGERLFRSRNRIAIE